MAGLDDIVSNYLYYPYRLPPDLPPPVWARGAEEVWMECKDGIRIHGLWWSEPGAGPVILFLHGNAQEVYSWSLIRQELEPLGCRLLLIDYHGYGKSGGEPSENALYMDGRAALAWLKEHGVDDHEIIVFGKSLGGGVACEIAQGRDFRALILESTFTSLARVAKMLLPFFAADLPIGDIYASIDKIRRVRCPVMVIHGDIDELIPVREGLDLYEAANDPKEIYIVAGAGHNDVSLMAGNEYVRRISSFLGYP